MSETPEYITCIVDELHMPIIICTDHTDTEIDKILDQHPEWSKELIRIN